MKTRAAVAFAANEPLEIVELDLEGPKAGEVLIEVKATGICHTDAYTLSGADPEGLFPAVLGHEGAGVGLGPISGELLASALCGERPALDLTPFDPDRFRPAPARRGATAHRPPAAGG